ncbi:MAG: DUF494 family protein [bacterium]
MNERVVEILVLIMSEINNGDNSAKLDLLSKDLLKKGYTENEISSAFSWLLERMKSDSEELIENQGCIMQNSFRHLHEVERSIISTESFGYMIQLKELGIIDENQLEQILERAMMLGVSHINITEIKTIVASVLFNPENVTESSFFFFDEHPIIH